MEKKQEQNDRKVRTVRSVMYVSELIVTGFCVTAALITESWLAVTAWVLVGIYQSCCYVQTQDIDFWKKQALETSDLAGRAIKENESLLKEYRKLLDQRKEDAKMIAMLSSMMLEWEKKHGKQT